MLDLNTLRLVSMVSFACFALATVMLWRLVPQERGLREWAVATTLVSISMLLFGLRNIIPSFISIVVANTLLMLGFGLLYVGTRKLFSLSVGFRWHWLAAVTAFLICLSPDVSIRVSGTSMLQAPFLAACAWLFWRGKGERQIVVMQRITAFIFAVGAVMFVIRIFKTPPASTPSLYIAAQSWIEVIPYLYAIMFSMLLSLTLLLIVSLRLQRQRNEMFVKLSEKEEQLTLATSRNGIGIWDFNLTTQELTCDDLLLTFYNRKREQFNNSVDTWMEWLHPDDLASSYQKIQDAISGKVPFNHVFRVIWPNGEIHHIQARATLLPDSAGKPLRMLGTNIDITESRQSEAALKDSEFRWKFAIEGSGDGVWDWNIQTDEVHYSKRWKEMLGYGDEDILPTNDEWANRVHPEDQLYVRNTMQAYLEGVTEIYVVEYRLRCKDNSYKWILGRGMIVNRSKDGKPLRMIGTHTDISERKNLEAELTEQAHLDYLTGLSNRRHFMAQGEVELSRSIRYDTPLSLMMLDIDFFKNVNDTYGHQVGDTVLQVLSKICQNTLRQVDVAGRLGGEEFAVILPETTSEEALDVAERLRKAIANTDVTIPVGLPIHFTVSIGVTTLNNKDVNIDMLLHQADQALYEAKEAGRNRVCVG